MMMDAVVVGAGPYGLSVAANLLRLGLRVRVFGRHMEMWREQMPEGMVLKSDGFATNFGSLPLTLEKFCHATGRPFQLVGHRTPLCDVIAYAEAVRAEYVGQIDDVRVARVESRSTGFVVKLADGDEVASKRVVCATGLMGFQRMPKIKGMPEHRITHVSRHHALDGFAGTRVLVLGAGQSAFETAALLHERGARVEILSRRQPVWFDPEGEAAPSRWTRVRHPNFGLGPGWRAWLWSEAPNLFHYLPAPLRLSKAYSTFGPAGSGWLKERVVGKIPVQTGIIKHALDTADGVQVTADIDNRLQIFEADHVIAATGYSPDITKIECLRPMLEDIECLAHGIPKLDRSFQTSLRGLHVVGNLSAASMGPSMRFIYGTNLAAPQLAFAMKAELASTVGGYSSTKREMVSS
jgi:hypothetical protein